MSSSTPIPREPSQPGRQIRYVSTLDAYEQWASIYDTDSNALQALDDEEVIRLLPQLLSLSSPPTDRPLRILDLGCGTGRNTLKLLTIPGADIYGVDLSPKMLYLARQRCKQALSGILEEERPGSLTFYVHDVLDPNPEEDDTGSGCERLPADLEVDIIISTLVVEHMPLPDFFAQVNKLLVPGGLLLVTNMHSEMGARSQAGFNDPATGEKVRPVSYNHSPKELEDDARRAVYEVVGGIRERGVDEGMVGRLGPRAEKWIGCMMWMGGIFRRVDGGEGVGV